MPSTTDVSGPRRRRSIPSNYNTRTDWTKITTTTYIYYIKQPTIIEEDILNWQTELRTFYLPQLYNKFVQRLFLFHLSTFLSDPKYYTLNTTITLVLPIISVNTLLFIYNKSKISSKTRDILSYFLVIDKVVTNVKFKSSYDLSWWLSFPFPRTMRAVTLSWEW